MVNLSYASWTARVRATMIDSVIVSTMLIGGALIASVPEIPKFIRIFSMFSCFFYEPILISMYGMTIGKKIKNIQVVDKYTKNKIGLIKSFFRYLLKITIGGPSLLMMLFASQRQAFHDYVLRTVVLNCNTKQNEVDTVDGSVLKRAA